MKKSKKTIKIIAAVIIFCLLYIVLAFRMLSTELHLSPEWTVDISDQETVSPSTGLIPYRLGQNIGYFTEDGKIASRIPYPFKAAVSDSYYAVYGSNNDSTDFYKADGTPAGTIKEQGFPFFGDSHVYLFFPGGNAFAGCSGSGDIKWKYESYAPVTAFSTSRGGVIAGFADGNLASFDHEGHLIQKFAPGGSEVPVILGAAISDDGKTVACVSGQNRQRFVVAQKTDDGHSKIIFHEYLDEDFNSQVLVKFGKDGKTIYYNYRGGMGIVDMEKLVSRKVPVEGRIVQIEEFKDSWLTAVLSEKDGTYTVTIIEPADHPVAEFSFDAGCAFIQVKGDKLFLGRDTKISCLNLSRK
ncbi:MAG: hypothetical protein II563_03275 [Treponema sp.]|nr:hypothetical protein [Treponema sp.]MBQ2551855.1 hypothetical protein [Treponema sp.]MBQ5385115.1 hypothetical protein [Treponema sp.]